MEQQRLQGTGSQIYEQNIFASKMEFPFKNDNLASINAESRIISFVPKWCDVCGPKIRNGAQCASNKNFILSMRLHWAAFNGNYSIHVQHFIIFMIQYDKNAHKIW